MPPLKSITTPIILTLFVGYILYHSEATIKILSSVPAENSAYALFVITAQIASILTNGYTNNHINLKTLGIVTTFKEWAGLSAITSMYNIIMPMKSGGLPKAIYLKSTHNFSYTKFISVQIFTTYISIVSLTAFSITYLGALQPPHVPHHILISVMYYMTTGLILFILFPLACIALSRIPLPRHVFFQYIRITSDLFTQQIQNAKLILAYTLNTIINLFLSATMLYYALKAINTTADYTSLIPINIILAASHYISLSPGNIGIQEILTSVFSTISGLTVETGLVAAILIRFITTSTNIVLGLAFRHTLNKTST